MSVIAAKFIVRCEPLGFRTVEAVPFVETQLGIDKPDELVYTE